MYYGIVLESVNPRQLELHSPGVLQVLRSRSCIVLSVVCVCVYVLVLLGVSSCCGLKRARSDEYLALMESWSFGYTNMN